VRADEQEPNKRRECRTSKRLITKSISIKDTKRRFGGCALKVDELTSGELALVAENPKGWKPTKCGVIGTEATAAVSRRHSRWPKRAGTNRKDSPTEGRNEGRGE